MVNGNGVSISLTNLSFTSLVVEDSKFRNPGCGLLQTTAGL